MQILCTVPEFAEIIRGCSNTMEAGNCPECPLYNVCDCDGSPDSGIERFVSAENIVT